MKHICKILFCMMTMLTSVLYMQAQEAPTAGWMNKIQKSIVSLNSYDKDMNLLHSGTAFYISSDGVAVADYNLLRDAYSAVVVDQSGDKSEVVRILGADDIYGLVKFKTNARKATPLKLSSSFSNIGTKFFVLPFSKNKMATCPAASVVSIDTVDNTIPYYSLDYPLEEKYIGCPAFNQSGELVATLQLPLNGKGHALGIHKAEALSIQALSTKVNNYALNNIHIKKGLPDSMEESLVYLYFKSRSADNDEYLDLLNLFIEAYPNNAEGYYRRATPYIDIQKFDEADKDLQSFYKLSTDKAYANSRIAEIIYTKLLYQPTPEYSKWNYDLAIDYVDKAIAANNSLDNRLLKTKILVAMKNYDGALEIFDAINNSEERSPATYYAASMASERRGDTVNVQIAMMDSAIAMFSTPLPTEAASYVMRRAQLYEKAGRYREAVLDYNQYCYLNNNKVNARFHYDRALIEQKAKMYQQALDDLDAAISLAPKEALFHVEKSAVFIRIGQIDDCISEAKKSLELNPNLPDAYRIMGYAQIEKGEKALGKQNLQKAIDLGDEAAQELMNQYSDK